MYKHENDNDGIAATTIKIWTPRLVRKLTPEDSRQILINVTGFAKVIAEWARSEGATPHVADNDNVNKDRDGSILLPQESERGSLQ